MIKAIQDEYTNNASNFNKLLLEDKWAKMQEEPKVEFKEEAKHEESGKMSDPEEIVKENYTKELERKINNILDGRSHTDKCEGKDINKWTEDYH